MMILFIIGAAGVFSFMLSSLFITRAIAGFFLPAVAVILTINMEIGLISPPVA